MCTAPHAFARSFSPAFSPPSGGREPQPDRNIYPSFACTIFCAICHVNLNSQNPLEEILGSPRRPAASPPSLAQSPGFADHLCQAAQTTPQVTASACLVDWASFSRAVFPMMPRHSWSLITLLAESHPKPQAHSKSTQHPAPPLQLWGHSMSILLLTMKGPELFNVIHR